MYSEGRFRWRDSLNYPYSDDATCGGAMILFLNGIVPDTGSLAIPVIEETFQDWYSMFPPSHFRFDYESQTIRIPVWAGKINFTFGTEPASYSFPDNGIYEVNFSSDWNSVTNAIKVSSLSEPFAYLDPHADNPPPQDTTAPTIIVSSPQNKTYSVAEILLKFAVKETVSQISYSLDGQDNVIITGNTTLTGLPYGSHTLTVYATDEAVNNEISETIYFIIAEPFPTMIAATLAMAAVGGAASGIYYIKKAKNGKR